jgi:hypothetical protein
MRPPTPVLRREAPLPWSGRCRPGKRPRSLAPMPQIHLDATVFANVPIFLSAVESWVRSGES